jgi:hypothetical protein
MGCSCAVTMALLRLQPPLVTQRTAELLAHPIARTVVRCVMKCKRLDYRAAVTDIMTLMHSAGVGCVSPTACRRHRTQARTHALRSSGALDLIAMSVRDGGLNGPEVMSTLLHVSLVRASPPARAPSARPAPLADASRCSTRLPGRSGTSWTWRQRTWSTAAFNHRHSQVLGARKQAKRCALFTTSCRPRPGFLSDPDTLIQRISGYGA